MSSSEPNPDSSNQLRMTREQLTVEFTNHRDRLWRAVHVRMDPRLYGRVDPDDVLQEAYLDAEKRLGHFAEEVGFTPFVWLRLIVGQTLINVHRRHIGAQKRDASRERSQSSGLKYQYNATSQQFAFQLAASQTSPSEVLMRDERVSQLAASLESLSEVDREILTLRHFEDLSNKEIAQLLGIEQKAASIRYVRAIKRLKECLGGQEDFHGMGF
ncbi:MAG: sigma-70 family RNA polymerase sigma factor [Planctomycetota bacterium]